MASGTPPTMINATMMINVQSSNNDEVERAHSEERGRGNNTDSNDDDGYSSFYGSSMDPTTVRYEYEDDGLGGDVYYNGDSEYDDDYDDETSSSYERYEARFQEFERREGPGQETAEVQEEEERDYNSREYRGDYVGGGDDYDDNDDNATYWNNQAEQIYRSSENAYLSSAEFFRRMATLSLTDDTTTTSDNNNNRPAAAAAIHHPSSAIKFKPAEEGQDTCCVCLDNVPDCKLTGCHKSTAGGYICGVCADRLVRGSRKCPLCRGNATRYEVVVVEAEVAAVVVVPIQKKEDEEETPDSWDD